MTMQHDKLMANNYHQAQAPASSRFITGSKIDQPKYFVDVSWLKQQINDRNSDLIIIDVTRGVGNYPLDVTRVADDYAKAHIPGAIHLNTDELGEFKDYFVSPEEMRDVFLSKGITKDSLVVFYSVYARDIMYIASRMAFAAYYLGVDNVKILDGGMQAWERAGYDFEAGINEPVPAESFGAEVPVRPELLVSTPDDILDAQRANPDLKLVSVRTWNEFTGLNEGHAWNKGSGDIAGAVHAGDELLANVNGELADPAVYRSSWDEWDITPDEDLVLYCGTSWRSSTMFFLMKELGFQHLRLYDGSWYKWYLAHEENPRKYPIQQGDPRKPDEYRIISE